MTAYEWNLERAQLIQKMAMMHRLLWSKCAVGHEQLDVLAADKVCFCQPFSSIRDWHCMQQVQPYVAGAPLS